MKKYILREILNIITFKKKELEDILVFFYIINRNWFREGLSSGSDSVNKI
jgi:hypothetical protein